MIEDNLSQGAFNTLTDKNEITQEMCFNNCLGHKLIQTMNMDRFGGWIERQPDCTCMTRKTHFGLRWVFNNLSCWVDYRLIGFLTARPKRILEKVVNFY